MSICLILVCIVAILLLLMCISTPTHKQADTQEESFDIATLPPVPASTNAAFDGSLVKWYDWKRNKRATCASYNTDTPPRKQQDCPDTSFSYVSDMSQYIPGAKGGGCIQLGIDAQNWCWTTDGNYDVWWDKVATQSA